MRSSVDVDADGKVDAGEFRRMFQGILDEGAAEVRRRQREAAERARVRAERMSLRHRERHCKAAAFSYPPLRRRQGRGEASRKAGRRCKYVRDVCVDDVWLQHVCENARLFSARLQIGRSALQRRDEAPNTTRPCEGTKRSENDS